MSSFFIAFILIFIYLGKKLGIELAGHEITQPMHHESFKSVRRVDADEKKAPAPTKRKLGM